MTIKVFVYGTLRQGQRYHHLIQDNIRSVQNAIVHGILYHLPYQYPALFSGASLVAGELFELEDAAASLAILDELEDYRGPGQDNEYERQIVTATTADGNPHSCYLYIYAESKRSWVEQNGILVESGDWVRWKRENPKVRNK